MPYTRATVIGTKVRKEVSQPMSIGLKRLFNYVPLVSLLATITTHHNAIIISQINASNFGVIKVLVRTAEIGPCVDRRLRLIEFEES